MSAKGAKVDSGTRVGRTSSNKNYCGYLQSFAIDLPGVVFTVCCLESGDTHCSKLFIPTYEAHKKNVGNPPQGLASRFSMGYLLVIIFFCKFGGSSTKICMVFYLWIDCFKRLRHCSPTLFTILPKGCFFSCCFISCKLNFPFF